MARLKIEMPKKYIDNLSALGDNTEKVVKGAIYEGAGIVAGAIKNNLKSVLSGESTGQLENSLGITPILQSKNGIWNAKVGFTGYDSKGTPNALKARVLESGSSKQKKRPFVNPAVRATKEQVISTMSRIIDNEIKNIMNK